MFGIVRRLVNIIIGVIEFLLTLRLVFEFFSANSAASFVVWLYGATAQLVGPFVGIFPNLNLGGFIIDFATLIALIVYVLIGYLILEIFSYTNTRYYRDDGDYRDDRDL